MSGAFPHLPADAWELFRQDRLPASSTEKMEEHLEGCDDCRQVLRSLEPTRLFAELRGWEPEPTDWSDATADLLGALPERGAAAEPQRIRSGLARWGFLSGVASVLMLLALPSQAPPPPTAPSFDNACLLSMGQVELSRPLRVDERLALCLEGNDTIVVDKLVVDAGFELGEL
ncbi:MAG: hypothetical protein AAF533_16725 [Acidobacteriota bacterium]